MKIFNIDDVEGSTHKPRTWNTKERLHRLDHVIVHTGWRPFQTGNTEAYGVGYIDDISHDDNTFSVEWVDEDGECRAGLAWIPREYLEKTSAELDRHNVGKPDDEAAIKAESDDSTLLDLLDKMSHYIRR